MPSKFKVVARRDIETVFEGDSFKECVEWLENNRMNHFEEVTYNGINYKVVGIIENVYSSDGMLVTWRRDKRYELFVDQLIRDAYKVLLEEDEEDEIYEQQLKESE